MSDIQTWRDSKIPVVRLALSGIGLVLLVLGCYSLAADLGAVYTFLGGFLFLTGLQVFTWSLGIYLEILGNVPPEYEPALVEAELSPPRKSVERTRGDVQRLRDIAAEILGGAREVAAQEHSAASERADLYSQAAEEIDEVVKAARGRGMTVAEAIEAGKRAYQEEKRKTEMPGRIEAEPRYKEKPN